MLEKFLEKAKTLAFRIQVLKIFCVILLAVIATRLYAMQITYSAEYSAYLNGTSSSTLQKNVPRGIIYDRNLEVLVDNEAVNTITYQYSLSVSTSEMRSIASKLAELIEVDTSSLKTRDLKDLFIITFEEEAAALMADVEVEDDEYYSTQLELITDEHLEQLTDHDKATQVIYNHMNQGTNLTSNIIKKGATEEEVAAVSEQLPSLTGVDVGVDWDRTYPSDVGYLSIFGRVSSYEQGLPATSAEEYLAYGYQSNERVGLSQLEAYYESLLSGYKSDYYVSTENDTTTAEEIYEGQSGFGLSLTLDANLQATVDEIVENALLDTKKNDSAAKYLREAYVVMLNPNTGEILSMNGKTIEYNEETKKYEVTDNALGTFQSAFTPGSVVKGATLMAGYDSGATSIGEYRTDETLTFIDGSKKSSWKTLGRVNDSDALMYSSNIYFMLQTIRMGGGTYTKGGSLSLSLDVYDTYRDFFSQFGLGVSTGIDLYNESMGLKDSTGTAAKLLDYAIGQADTYTTMQLAQYVSTLATNGKRYATQILGDVYIPATDTEEMQLIQGFTPRLLNVVNMDESYFERVRDGFTRALQNTNGTGYSVFKNVDYNPAGKTGTAQEYARGSDGKYIYDSNDDLITVHNVTFVGYAPADNPEVAIAVVVPQGELPNDSNSIAQEIARDALQAYFDNK